MRTALDIEESVPRSNIASYAAAGVSLMPDGLEEAMSKKDISDLIAYLRQGAARVTANAR